MENIICSTSMAVSPTSSSTGFVPLPVLSSSSSLNVVIHDDNSGLNIEDDAYFIV